MGPMWVGFAIWAVGAGAILGVFLVIAWPERRGR